MDWAQVEDAFINFEHDLVSIPEGTYKTRNLIGFSASLKII
ncbi:hypothetical protein EMIT0P43_30292 [Pseudomonas jessenii]